MAIDALSPKEMKKQYNDQVIIPDFVISAVNNLLVKNYNPQSKEIRLYQEDIIDAILKTYIGNREDIFDNHWLDFEPIYINKGWNCEYHKVLLSTNKEGKYFTFSVNNEQE